MAVARRKPRRFNGSGEACPGFSQKDRSVASAAGWYEIVYQDTLHLANHILLAGSTVRRSRG